MKLELFLEDRKLSAAEFAEKIGVSAVSVTRYLAGTRRPRPTILSRIAKETEGHVTPNDFMLTSQPEQAA